MPTFATFRGKDLEPSFAEKIGAAPEARVRVEVISPEEEETERRREAGKQLSAAMTQFSKEAEAAGITDADIQAVLNEK